MISFEKMETFIVLNAPQTGTKHQCLDVIKQDFLIWQRNNFGNSKEVVDVQAARHSVQSKRKRRVLRCVRTSNVQHFKTHPSVSRHSTASSDLQHPILRNKVCLQCTSKRTEELRNRLWLQRYRTKLQKDLVKMLNASSMAGKLIKNASSFKSSSPMCTIASKTIQLTFVDVEVRSSVVGCLSTVYCKRSVILWFFELCVILTLG